MSMIERLATTTVTFRDRWLRLGRMARYTTWLEWPEPDIVLALLLGSVVVGCAGVLATTAIGSGDYGQWLMTSRSYLGVGIPAYRADWAVPPLVPWVLAVLQLFLQPIVAVHVMAVLLLVGLGAAAYAVGSTLFETRLSGLMTCVAALLLTDRYMDLFAFGGLLQAAAVICLWLAVAALWRARRGGPNEWVWWSVGAWCLGAGALAHTGTSAISLPSGLAVGALCCLAATRSWIARLRRLVPIGMVLLLLAAYWWTVVLPDGANLVSNPASLEYRGFGRLIESLLDYPPTVPVMVLGSGAVLVGAAFELRRRRIGPYLAVGAWMIVTVAVTVTAALTSTSTDYPRFATPLLAPFVVAAGGALAFVVGAAGRWAFARFQRGSATAWSAGAAFALVAVTVPSATGGFVTDANGYRLPDVASLIQAADWINKHVPSNQAVLAPAREGKWIEGLTGRSGLFTNAVRYSFRADEWERSLVADALLRSDVAFASEFFFARMIDPTGVENTPRRVSIAANHGGEFIDLLQTVPSRTTMLRADGTTLALLTDLAGGPPRQTVSYAQDAFTTAWSTVLHGSALTYRQTVVVTRDSSTLELRASLTSGTPTSGFELELRPAGSLPIVSVDGGGSQATVSFGQIGSRPPALRLVIAGGNGTVTALPDGGLRIHTKGAQLRLLITDLTAASSPTIGLQVLQPADLVKRYDVGAVLLPHDAVFDARKSRLGRLGFRVADSVGPYTILVRS